MKIPGNKNVCELIQEHEDKIEDLQKKVKSPGYMIQETLRAVLFYSGVKSIIKALNK